MGNYYHILLYLMNKCQYFSGPVSSQAHQCGEATPHSRLVFPAELMQQSECRGWGIALRGLGRDEGVGGRAIGCHECVENLESVAENSRVSFRGDVAFHTAQRNEDSYGKG